MISRIRRQTFLNTIQLRVELRDDPSTNLNTAPNTNIVTLNAAIINQYQCGSLQTTFDSMTNTMSVTPLTLNVQEPNNQTTVALSVISQLVLITPPSGCRAQCACDVQPVLVAYNTTGYVIDKLGSNDQPWQVVATVISPAGVSVIGAIANYSQGQTNYTAFGVTANVTVIIQFSFISPYGVVA